MKRTRLVNEHGEIIGTMSPGDRIVRKASLEFLDETIAWGKGRPFIKVFTDYYGKVALDLSGGAITLMSVIAPHIAYNSNLLCKRGRVTEPLNNNDIAELAELGRARVGKYMDELVRAKVLFRGRTGNSFQYYANPYIYCKGSKINKTLEAMFKGYPDEYK